MPLGPLDIAKIEANRALLRQGREEYVTLVTHAGGLTGLQAVPCSWFDAGKVPAGVMDRVGYVSRQPWDALVLFQEAQTWSAVLMYICRTPVATSEGVAAANDRLYTVLQRLRMGIGVTSGTAEPPDKGDRWVVLLRRLRYEI